MISLYTETGYCINDLIKSGRTKTFTDRKEAKKFAKSRRTYIYSALDKRRQFVCFAVPLS